MPFCSSCGSYYRTSPWNNSDICDVCYEHAEDTYPSEEEVQTEVDQVLHKDGSYKVKLIFYD